MNDRSGSDNPAPNRRALWEIDSVAVATHRSDGMVVNGFAPRSNYSSLIHSDCHRNSKAGGWQRKSFSMIGKS